MIINVYIIEDTSEYLDLLQEYLRKIFKDKNLKFMGFSHPLDALPVILKNRPEIIVSDHSLPGMEGSVLLKEIYKHYKPYTILHSGNNLTTVDKIADFYIPKLPGSIIKIPEAIEKILIRIKIDADKAIENVLVDIEGDTFDKLLLKNAVRIVEESENSNDSIKKGLYRTLSEVMKKSEKAIRLQLSKIKKNNINTVGDLKPVELVYFLSKRLNGGDKRNDR